MQRKVVGLSRVVCSLIANAGCGESRRKLPDKRCVFSYVDRALFGLCDVIEAFGCNGAIVLRKVICNLLCRLCYNLDVAVSSIDTRVFNIRVSTDGTGFG